MINLTIKAANKIKEYLEQTPEASGFRINLKSGGCSGFEYIFGLDSPTEEDNIYKSNSITILINKNIFKYIKNSIIDFKDDINNNGFSIDNPNETGCCGCRKSACFD